MGQHLEDISGSILAVKILPHYPFLNRKDGGSLARPISQTMGPWWARRQGIEFEVCGRLGHGMMSSGEQSRT